MAGPEAQLWVQAEKLRGSGGMKGVYSVFVDAEDGGGAAEGFGLVWSERGGIPVVGGVVGVEEERIVGVGGVGAELGGVPVVDGGERGGFEIVVHVDNVGLFGGGEAGEEEREEAEPDH